MILSVKDCHVLLQNLLFANCEWPKINDLGVGTIFACM